MKETVCRAQKGNQVENNHVIIEKDLAGIWPTQALMDQIKAEVLQASAAGATEIDIVIRRVACAGSVFPNFIVDQSGELLQILAKAVQLINTSESQEIEKALALRRLIRSVGSEAQQELLLCTIELAVHQKIPIARILGCDDIAHRERQVLDAAINQRMLERTPVPVDQVDGGKYEESIILTRHAIDALVAAREKEKSAG